MERSAAHIRRARAFTLLEVALIVAIIGMMLLMIIGYLLAPKKDGPLPPVAEPTPVPSVASAVTPATPAPSATPSTTIELTPGAAPTFR